MCIIIYKEIGKTLKEEWLDNSASSNADGFGLSYMHPDKGLTIYKTMVYKDFKEEYFRLESSYGETTNFILHFRKTTDGGTNIKNCHPFEVNGIVMFHNGRISKCKPEKWDDRSDTNIFAEDVLGNLPNGWFDNETVLDLVEHYVGASKLVFMDEEGSTVILNESMGHWIDGIWMSNYSYYPNTRSVQKAKPLSWNANKTVADKKGVKKTCYRHPDGRYTKYQGGVRFLWYPSQFLWAKIDDSGNRINTCENHYQDAPSITTYNVISVTYGLKLKDMPSALVVASATGVCDWCDHTVPKDKLSAWYWFSEDERLDDTDVSLVCEHCCVDAGVEEFMTKCKNANIDFYIKNGTKGIWGHV